MIARETVIERVTRIAAETAERKRSAADVMRKIISEGSWYFIQYRMKRRMPPPEFFEKMAGQLMSIAYAYEEQRGQTVGYPKNPVLAAFFREIGRADELGSGIRKMMRYGRKYGGADPQLIEGDVFRMIISVPDFEQTSKQGRTQRTLEKCERYQDGTKTGSERDQDGA